MYFEKIRTDSSNLEPPLASADRSRHADRPEPLTWRLTIADTKLSQPCPSDPASPDARRLPKDFCGLLVSLATLQRVNELKPAQNRRLVHINNAKDIYLTEEPRICLAYQAHWHSV